ATADRIAFSTVAPREPVRDLLRRNFEKDSQVWQQSGRTDAMERQDILIGHTPAPTPVSARGVEKAVANDPPSRLERWPNGPGQMICPRCREQKRFSCRGPPFARRIEDQLADRFGTRGAARLTGEQDF